MTAYTTFSKEVFAAFRADNRAGPVHMLNLIRLHDTAVYPSGERESGVEAYAAYGRISGPVFTGLGGKIIWRGQWELEVIGPADERWDICFIAEYPSVASFAEMAKNPVHRSRRSGFAIDLTSASSSGKHLLRVTERSTSLRRPQMARFGHAAKTFRGRRSRIAPF